jgi:N-acetylglucosaminyl-diphospho-decaprenol L-rhamnosyltransferase
VIYFITINYYSTELIKRLITSIAAAAKEYSILIVNNSPDDTSINRLAKAYPSIIVITAEKNLGFGAGCNLGIQYVYKLNPQAIIWLINPDTKIEKIAISYIKKCFNQDHSIAILGTRVRDLQGKIWFGFGTFNRWTGSLKHQLAGGESSDSLVNTLPCHWVSGCSMLLNLSQFKNCPSFDPNYFLYYEDADLCERYYKQGYRIAVTQAVLVTHTVSALSQRNPCTQFKHATFSKLYFLQQHGTALALYLNLLYMLVLVVLLFPKNRPVALGRWQGLTNFIYWQIGKVTKLYSTP